MADNDNVVKLPDPLERRAVKIEAALVRRDKSREEWIAATIELAIELAGARDEFVADQAFGEWLDSRFPHVRIPKNDRAALIRWGREPDRAHAMLSKTERTSYQHIHANEWIPPTPQPPLPPPPEPKLISMPPAQPAPQPTPLPTPKPSQAAVLKQLDRAEAIRQGKTVQPLPLDIETVNSIHKQVRDLATTVPNLAGKARRSFEKTLAAEMTKLIAELNLHKERINIEAAAKIEQEVKRRLTLQLPEYEKRVTAAREREEYYGKLVRAVKVPLTQAEFETIRNILHPNAHPMATDDTKKKLNDAFVILNLKKLNLTGKK
jgi:hypothetical protein